MEQVTTDKTQRRSHQAPCHSTQVLGAPSQPVAEERRTHEHAPYPSKRDCSPARLGHPTATTPTVWPPPPRKIAQPALRKEEQRSTTDTREISFSFLVVYPKWKVRCSAAAIFP